MELLLTIDCSALPSRTQVVSMVGREGISQIYQFDIGLEITDDTFNPDEALRSRARVDINLGHERGSCSYHGVVVAMELLQQWAGKALYRATLVPKMWDLTQTHHSRIYTNNTILEIIEAVLTNSGLAAGEFSIQTTGSYASIEHVCQYKESNFAFISRWMEREGLYYFFKHDGQQEQLIITDDLSLHPQLNSGRVRYVPLSGDDHMALEALDTFTAKHSALPAAVQLTDYNYLNPNAAVQGSQPISSSGVGNINMFGETSLTSADASRYARVRAEQRLAEQKVFVGKGRVFQLRPNYSFTLDDHPNPNYDNKRYLATQIEHMAVQEVASERFRRLLGIPGARSEYSITLHAISAEVQFRAPYRHLWPRVDGYEFARICGEATSDYAQIDQHGRYKCRVLFDESDLVDGSATTYVRMMQPHGGGVEGFHFPLRKGTEVLMFFLGGDPDRPVIAGTVPNPQTPSPVTSGNHTKNIIQTGGYNRLEMEDQAGRERITLWTPHQNSYLRMGSRNDDHEVILNTDGSGLVDMGVDLDIDVGISSGGGKMTLDVQDSYRETIHTGDMTTSVKLGDKRTFVTQGKYFERVKTSFTTHVMEEDYAIHVHNGSFIHNIKTDWTTTVKTGNTKLDTELGTTDLLSKSDIHIGADTGHITVDTETGNITIEAKNGQMDIISKKDLNLKSDAKVNMTSAKEWYEQFNGDYFKVSASNGFFVTLAMESKTTLGLSNVNFIGGKVTTTLAALADFSLSLKFTMSGGISINHTYGAHLTFNNAAKVTVGLAELETVAARVEQLPTYMGSKAVNFTLSGIHVLT